MKKIQCPGCRGIGGETEPVLDDGTGPWYDCSYCNGSGFIGNRKRFYEVLGYVSWDIRKRKQRRHNFFVANKTKENIK